MQQLREISREKSAEMNRLYSQMSQLGQHNAELVLKNIDVNTRMADLGARQQALEVELARVTDVAAQSKLNHLKCTNHHLNT